MGSLSDLLLHPKTAARMQLYVNKPPQAILITGPIGSGKKTLAKTIASTLLNLDVSKKLSDYPYFLHLKRPENKQEIPIEAVRELIKAQSLTTPGSDAVRSVILIENAGDLSIPAQHALLKILEEPKEGTVFILTAKSKLVLLPTITSRTQSLSINSVSLDAAKEFWKEKKPDKEIENAWRLSQGNVGLLSALLDLDEEHSLKLAVKEARTFIGLDRYDRLLLLDKLSKSKEEYLLFLEALNRITNALHHAAIRKNNNNQAKRLLNARKAVFEAQEAVLVNTSARLVSLRLLLNLHI